MKTIKITLPAKDISLSHGDGITQITYMSKFNGKDKGFVYQILGYFHEYTLTDNLLTLK